MPGNGEGIERLPYRVRKNSRLLEIQELDAGSDQLSNRGLSHYTEGDETRLVGRKWARGYS
jgi:hypothetical protein